MGGGPLVVAGAWAAGVAVAPAAGWALATEGGTLLALLAVAGVAGVCAALLRAAALRGASAGVAVVALLGLVVAIAEALDRPAARGPALVVAAGAVLVAGTRARLGETVTLVVAGLGAAGVGAGALLAADAPEPYLAVALTVAVPALLLAGREALAWTGLAVAVTAVWAWAGAADVRLLEAYTLPAAAAALTPAALGRRGSSWALLGPGLALALLPSLGLAVDAGGARPVVLAAAALAVVLAGTRGGRQAPLVIGAVTLLLLGLDALAPVAARLPRWVPIGAAGLALLGAGATWERRLTQLRDLRARYDALEPAPDPG